MRATMSESVNVWIKIGGGLPEDKLGELMEAIVNEGVSLEWGEDLMNDYDVGEIIQIAGDGMHLCLYDHRSSGTMEWIRTACQSLGLSYIEYADPTIEDQAQRISWWTPDMGHERQCAGVHDEPALALNAVSAVKDNIPALAALLADHTLPSLPAFRLVDPPDLYDQVVQALQGGTMQSACPETRDDTGVVYAYVRLREVRDDTGEEIANFVMPYALAYGKYWDDHEFCHYLPEPHSIGQECVNQSVPGELNGEHFLMTQYITIE
jgi:hypothetical protein